MANATVRRSRRFNVVIDAFNGDINLTGSDPQGVFSPAKYNLSTMDSMTLDRPLGRDFIPDLIPTPAEGALNTILLVEEQAGPAELSPKKGAQNITLSPRESVEGAEESPVIPPLNIGVDGIPTAVLANVPQPMFGGLASKKQR